MSYDELDDKEKLKMVPVINNYNNVNIVIPTEATVMTTSKMITKTFLMKTLTKKSKQPPKPLSTQKWQEQ